MTSQKTKPADPCKWLDDAPEKATRWRNVYFQTDGVVFCALRFYDTEEKVRAACEEYCARRLADLTTGQFSDCTITENGNSNIVLFRFSKYSHHMQIPVGEA